MPCDVAGVAGWKDRPVNSPVHGVVADDHRGNNVEDLTAEATEGVEDSVVTGTGEGVLSVCGNAVGDDTALLLAAWVLVSNRVPKCPLLLPLLLVVLVSNNPSMHARMRKYATCFPSLQHSSLTPRQCSLLPFEVDSLSSPVEDGSQVQLTNVAPIAEKASHAISLLFL